MLELDRLELAVKKCLEEIGGGQGIELPLLFGASDPFAGTLAGCELLLSLKRGLIISINCSLKWRYL